MTAEDLGEFGELLWVQAHSGRLEGTRCCGAQCRGLAGDKGAAVLERIGLAVADLEVA